MDCEIPTGVIVLSAVVTREIWSNIELGSKLHFTKDITFVVECYPCFISMLFDRNNEQNLLHRGTPFKTCASLMIILLITAISLDWKISVNLICLVGGNKEIFKAIWARVKIDFTQDGLFVVEYYPWFIRKVLADRLDGTKLAKVHSVCVTCASLMKIFVHGV